MGKPVSKEPLVEDSVLATASETESEAVIAFNFGESTGIFFIFVTALVVTFLAYQFCGCCIPRRCKRPKIFVVINTFKNMLFDGFYYHIIN